MKKMYGVEVMPFSSDTAFLHSSFKGRKFDVVLSNPPYSGKQTPNIEYKIILSLLGNGSEERSIAHEFVFVHPSTWLLDMKDKVQYFLNMKSVLDRKIKSMTMFSGNDVFGIKLFVPCMVYHADISYDGPCSVDYIGDKFVAEHLSDITKYGSSWEKLVKPLHNRVIKYCNTNGSIWDHRSKINDGKPSCQFARIRGNVNKNGAELCSQDFYTLVPKDNPDLCKGIRKPLDERGGPACTFSSSNERDNFLNYVKTDFARFCLSFHKNKSDTDCGELATIPWLDFTQSWNDEKLFKHFDINQETQDYIRSFLPDYYGIRKPNGNNWRFSPFTSHRSPQTMGGFYFELYP